MYPVESSTKYLRKAFKPLITIAHSTPRTRGVRCATIVAFPIIVFVIRTRTAYDNFLCVFAAVAFGNEIDFALVVNRCATVETVAVFDARVITRRTRAARTRRNPRCVVCG